MVVVRSSELPRYMVCGGAYWLNSSRSPTYAHAPVTNKEKTIDQIEGNAAHHIVAQCMRYNIDDYYSFVDKRFDDNYVITKTMIDWLSPTIDHLRFRNLETYVETTIDYSTGINQHVHIRGRCDFAQYDAINRILYIDDLKYGFKIVSPEMNWTLISYAIGTIQKLQIIPEKIIFTILQPRPSHPLGKIRSWEVSGATVPFWDKDICNRLEAIPEEFVTGPNCYRCPGVTNCPSSREATLASIDVAFSGEFDNLTGEEIAIELDLITKAQETIKIRKHALEDLARTNLRNNQYIPNYNLEPAESNLQWCEGIKAHHVFALTGVDVSLQTMITPTQAKKMNVPDEWMSLLAERVSRGFKLVRRDEQEKAKQLFGDKTQKTD